MKAVKKIQYSTLFERSLRKLSPDLLEEVQKREKLFRGDCFHPKLSTHKLKGKHKDLWSFSITHKHRIVFRFLSGDTVYFIDVGDHSIYR